MIKGITAKAEGDKRIAEVRIYDEISNNPYWGVSAKVFAEEIAALDVDELQVYINSPGGSAWDGMAIMNSLRRHKATVNVVVDGLAASAASLIAMAGDHVTMNRGSELMIHDTSGLAYGNAATMLETAEILNKLSDSYADSYAARAGRDRAHWREVMRAETWYTAEEAVLAGLADEWADAPAAEAKFDLSRFKHHGREDAPTPVLARADLPADRSGETLPAEPEGNETKGDAVAFFDEIKARLGLSEASEEEVLTAVEDLATQPDASLPEGVATIDATVLERLQADAAAGREALEAQAAERRQGIVKAAIAEGRITPASSAQWLAQLEKDEDGAKALIESFPKNTLPVVEVGRSDEPEVNADDELYAAWAGKKEDK